MTARVELVTRDPERALPTLEEYFPGVRMSNPHGDFALELVAAEVETLSVIRYRLWSAASTSSADLSDTFSFGQVGLGRLALSSGGDPIDTTQPWLFPEHRVDAEWDDVTITALTISKAKASQMARAHAGTNSPELRFLGTSPIDQARGRRWSTFVDYLCADLTNEDSGLDSSLVLTGAFAHLVGLALDTFPNTVMEAARDQHRPLTTPSAVRRAVAFIEANAHLPITVEDIARESRMTVRGLQYAFQRHLGTTPTVVLRRVRLAGAHRDLRNSDPTAGTTVLAVSRAWGFPHPGRFSQLYREAYGVSPKHTLDH